MNKDKLRSLWRKENTVRERSGSSWTDERVASAVCAILEAIAEDHCIDPPQNNPDARAVTERAESAEVRFILSAFPEESTVDAAKRVVAERAAAGTRAIYWENAKLDVLPQTRDVLLASKDESVADAAKRVVAERDRAQLRVKALEGRLERIRADAS